jgi:hypothetical protein
MKPNTPMSPKAINRRYVWEAGLALAAYVGAMILAGQLLHRGVYGDLAKVSIALFPLLPLALLFAVVFTLRVSYRRDAAKSPCPGFRDRRCCYGFSGPCLHISGNGRIATPQHLVDILLHRCDLGTLGDDFAARGLP